MNAPLQRPLSNIFLSIFGGIIISLYFSVFYLKTDVTSFHILFFIKDQKQESTKLIMERVHQKVIKMMLSLVLLLISNLTNGLRLHRFLVTKSEEMNKSVKSDANGAH